MWVSATLAHAAQACNNLKTINRFENSLPVQELKCLRWKNRLQRMFIFEFDLSFKPLKTQLKKFIVKELNVRVGAL